MQDQPALRHYKLLPFYVVILISIMHLCNALAYKVVDIDGFSIVMSGLIFPISFFFLNVITESYGFKQTERVILYILIAQFIFLSVMPLAVLLPSPAGVKTTQLYYDLYHKLWTVLICSFFGVSISYYSNGFVLSRLKVLLRGRHVIVRVLISNAISKGVLVLISYPIPFWHILSVKGIIIICINTWLFKVAFAAVIVYLTPLLSRWTMRVEGLDIYDFNTSYNPVKLFDPKHSGVNMYGRQVD